jgi:uncharacterized protein with von Willebrand factor type A (vWA) domain
VIPRLVDFVQTARRAGLPISPAESIDAARAVALVGYADRALLKDTLGTVLAKSVDDQRLFDACFERYYARETVAAGAPLDSDAGDRAQVRSALGALLLGEGGALAAAIEAAGARSELDAVRIFTQANGATYRVLERLGVRELDAEIARLRAGDARAAALAERLAERRAALREQIRALVAQRLALAAPENERWRDDLLTRMRITNVDRRDLARLRVLVRELARRLAMRYGRRRRRARRGALDVRRTLRANAATDGVPFRTVWKRRTIEKPRVLALCDVSGSVAAVAQFLLLFLFSLRDALSDVHAFAFSNRLIEVTAILERHPVEEASAQILRAVGFGTTDYGRSLAEFAAGWLDRVDRTTSILIMGDARSNFGNPRVDLLRALAARAKRVVWLNPEPRTSWATGDSEMVRYLPFCDVARVCASVHDLELTLADLLHSGA